jgi:Glycosyl hydrolases family 38 N-terminal domain/Alpha mannosidase middle domain/Glycosyl hydrolases family 38 C-terminal domain
MAAPVIHLIPHTHWDREWYLPLGGFRARLVGVLDELLAQLEADARLRSFLLDGQTVLLEDYLAVRPERREAVMALARTGRLQIGPWYVLADEQIPAGESLLRNLTAGQNDAARLGARLEVLHSPDAFGHPAIWPALAAEFGISTGCLWRGLDPGRTHHRDLAWWEAPDGRRVFIYHLPPDGYEIGSVLLVPEAQLAEAWERVASQVMPRAATRHVAIFVGADHHATSPDLGALAERLAARVPGLEVRFSRLDEFLRAARDEAVDLDTLSGELRSGYGYTWALQGVHGTRAPLKRRNSLIELGLVRQAEPLLALGAGRNPRAEGMAAVLSHAWREVIQCHFHDAIGGCCADEVARAMAVRFDDAEAAQREITRDALQLLAGHDPDRAREGLAGSPRLALWNPAARSRGGVVIADLTFFRRDVLVGPPGTRVPRRGPGVQPFVLRLLGESGETSEVAPQLLSAEVGLERLDARRHYPDQDEVDRIRVAFPLPVELPGLGLRLLEVIDGSAPPLEPFTAAQGRTLWNGRVEAAVAVDGTVALRAAGKAPLFKGLLGLVSERDAGDSYSFCPVPRDRRRMPRRAGRVLVTAEGPFVAALAWPLALRCGRRAGGGEGRVNARMELKTVGDSPVLRCTIALDNQAQDHRLRLRFPTGLRGRPALTGAQFGVIERAATRRPPGRFPAETPVATAPAHRWVAVARAARGLAVFLPGFFEYEWTAGGDLLVTLLRSIGELSRSDLRTRPGHAAWPTPTPEAQCLGAETITIGVAPVSSVDLAAPERLERMWEDAFLPPHAHWMRDYCEVTTPRVAEAGIALEGAGLVFSACAPASAGRGVVLRCYNVLDRAVNGRWSCPRPIARAQLIRADETALGPLAVGPEAGEIGFSAGPRAIVSVLVEFTE